MMSLVVVLCLLTQVTDWTPEERRLAAKFTPIPSPPSSPTNRFADDPNAAAVGVRLFHDQRLSANGKISCAHCHRVEHAFTDQRTVAKGLGTGTRNTMSLLDVGHVRQPFWDGAADSLWMQALEPFEAPLEHGIDRVTVLRKIVEDDPLRKAFTTVFGALPDLSDHSRFPPATPRSEAPLALREAWSGMKAEDQTLVNSAYANVGKAIEAFERTLVSPPAPFDAFAAALAAGNDEAAARAIPPAAQRGFRIFLAAGCRNCHSGPRFTDEGFHSNGTPPSQGQRPDAGRWLGHPKVLRSAFRADGSYSDDPASDQARSTASTPRQPDMVGTFRTPTLRHLEHTRPYMHDGSMGSLEEVVRHYNRLEGAMLDHHGEALLQPLGLDEASETDLVAFLQSLSAQIDR